MSRWPATAASPACINQEEREHMLQILDEIADILRTGLDRRLIQILWDLRERDGFGGQALLSMALQTRIEWLRIRALEKHEIRKS